MRRAIGNPLLLETIRFLKVKARENKSKIWETAAEQLARPRNARAELNLNHIARASAKDSKVLVPGKVLGGGAIKHPVTVGAFEFSQGAKRKIENAGGQCVDIKEFVNKNPNGTNVLLLR